MMRKCILAAVALTLMSAPLSAANLCIPLEVFNSKIMSVFGEVPVATGRADKSTVRIYVDLKDLSFTVAALSEDKHTICILATGDRFRPMIPEDVAGEPPVAPPRDHINITVIPKTQP